MSKFSEGDSVVIAQEGFYQGVEAVVEEVLDDGRYIVDLPVGYYNSVISKSDGSFGYAWHGESTKGTFSEDELLEDDHDDVPGLKDNALEIAEHPSEFSAAPWIPATGGDE